MINQSHNDVNTALSKNDAKAAEMELKSRVNLWGLINAPRGGFRSICMAAGKREGCARPKSAYRIDSPTEWKYLQFKTLFSLVAGLAENPTPSLRIYAVS